MAGNPRQLAGSPESGVSGVKPREDLATFKGYLSPRPPLEARLNANELPFPIPDAWREELVAELRALQINRYPDIASRALKEALASHLQVQPENVFVARGSNEVLQSLLLAFGGPTRKAMLFEPTYQMHSRIAVITGTAVVVGERNESFGIDPAVMSELCQRHDPEVLFICSPNNPTGIVEDDGVIHSALEATSGLVVLDAAYDEFSGRDSVSRWAAEFGRSSDNIAGTERMAIVRTFSKAWSLAGLRLGYLVASPDVVAACELVSLPYHMDGFVQAAGVVVLRHAGEVAGRVQAVVEERERVYRAMQGMPLRVWPSRANFLFFRLEGGAGEVVHELERRSIAVRDFSAAPGTESCLRVTIGLPRENDRFLEALAEVLAAPDMSAALAPTAEASRSFATPRPRDLPAGGSGGEATCGEIAGRDIAGGQIAGGDNIGGGMAGSGEMAGRY